MIISLSIQTLNCGSEGELAKLRANNERLLAPGSVPEPALRCCVLGNDNIVTTHWRQAKKIERAGCGANSSFSKNRPDHSLFVIKSKDATTNGYHIKTNRFLFIHKLIRCSLN